MKGRQALVHKKYKKEFKKAKAANPEFYEDYDLKMYSEMQIKRARLAAKAEKERQEIEIVD